MKTLFLNPPSFSRFDSAGARFAATRVTRSLWYPAWLAYATALVPNSKLIDCPASNLSLTDLLPKIRTYNLVVIYTSTPSFQNDLEVAAKIKERYPKIKIIFTGPHVSVLPEEALSVPFIDAVARKEFDMTILEISQGKPWPKVDGLSYKKNGRIVHNPDRQLLKDLNQIPFVAPIYKRDVPIGSYHLPFTLYPYIAIYAGRGCPNRCTFCLWPQTFTGRVYRKRSVDNVIEEIKWIKKNLLQVKEVFFDDDTFTVNHTWVNEFCQKIKSLKVTWSTNARADVPLPLLQQMKESGCRFLVVGYESGSSRILKNIKKGVTTHQMRQFTRNAKMAGLMIHGTFVLGLPGESKKTIAETYRFACELNCDTIQVSVAAPFPGTEFYEYCQAKGLIKNSVLIDGLGFQLPILDYPGLPGADIRRAARTFLIKYFSRPTYLLKTAKTAFSGNGEGRRIITSGWEFAKYLLR